MRFKLGDATDTALCVALKHEFMRCEDAFTAFVSLARVMIAEGDNPRIAYKTYNAYASFIHHLYEFMLGALARDRLDTSDLQPHLKDRYINGHAQRLLDNRRQAILNGAAPVWENDISYYPETIPETFAREFRECRNTVAHVLHERASLDLTEFYEQRHKFLFMLYFDIRAWWGRQQDTFPDLQKITRFSILLKKNLPSQ